VEFVAHVEKKSGLQDVRVWAPSSLERGGVGAVVLRSIYSLMRAMVLRSIYSLVILVF
jgi:hypothetical protein